MSPSTILETVRALERERVAATQCNDVSRLRSLLDETMVYISSAGLLYDKTSYLRAIETGELTYASDYHVLEEQHRIYPGSVMLIGMMFGHARLDGEQQVYNLRCMSVWRERAETWTMMGWQSSEFRPRPF